MKNVKNKRSLVGMIFLILVMLITGLTAGCGKSKKEEYREKKIEITQKVKDYGKIQDIKKWNDKWHFEHREDMKKLAGLNIEAEKEEGKDPQRTLLNNLIDFESWCNAQFDEQKMIRGLPHATW